MTNTIFEKNGSLLTVKPEGRLDTATSPELEKEITSDLEGVQNIVMDFERVEYLSSGGLRLLLTLEQKMIDQGGGLKLIHVNEYIFEVLEMMGMMNEMTIEKS